MDYEVKNKNVVTVENGFELEKLLDGGDGDEGGRLCHNNVIRHERDIRERSYSRCGGRQ